MHHGVLPWHLKLWACYSINIKTRKGLSSPLKVILCREGRQAGASPGQEESPPARQVGGHAVQLSPGDSLSYTTSPTESLRHVPHGESHPVDLSPSMASNASSFASSPTAASRKSPPPDDPLLSRWKDLDEGLTPRSLHLALEQSQNRPTANSNLGPSLPEVSSGA